MNKLLMLTIAVATMIFTAGCQGAERDGACAAPSITVSESTASPGQVIQVRGADFLDRCIDSIEVANGNQVDQSSPAPYGLVEIRWQQDDQALVLASVHAEKAGSWDVIIEIPTSALPGTASIFATYAEPVEITVQ